MTLQDCDTLFSNLIRARDNWTCVRCLTRFQQGAANLHNSHFHERAKKSVRYDPDNCDAVCSWCHLIWEVEKDGAYKEFKIQQLGKEAFAALERRARSPIKFGQWEIDRKYEELSAAMK